MSSPAPTPPRRTARRFAGLALLAAVGAGLVGVQVARGGGPEVVTGPVGGEKVGFLQDADIQQILRDEYQLEVDFTQRGSLDMVRDVDPADADDFLWPSSEVALAQYEQTHGDVEDANIFNSPLVLYSWDRVADALQARGVVTDAGGTLQVDLAALVDMIEQDTAWSALGLDLFGSVAVQTTNPSESNSGNMFSGLLANTINGGQVVNDATVGAVLPEVERIYSRLGFQQDSSGDLFTAFLQQGEGAFPLIAGYESQLMEFGLTNEAYRQLVQERVRVLYPRPTVWSSHPLIPLTAEGERLRDALQDERIQQLAWERHGFRSGTVSGAEDPADLAFTGLGIPTTIDSVVQMPSPAVMSEIAEALGT